MKSHKINATRRRFLQGLGGMAFALPALEYYAGNYASAGGGAPKRYVYMFGGVSTGRKASYLDDFSSDKLVPDVVGTGYDLKRALLPLQDFNVRDHVSVVSNLFLPSGTTGSIPAGGRHVGFHASSLCPLICGTRSHDDGVNEAATAPSSDQVVAGHIAGDTPQPVLAYRVQARYYRGSNGGGGNRGRITYRETEGGAIEPIDPIASPRLAYESLFGGFIPPDPAEAALARLEMNTRRSTVDIVHGATTRLIPKLGMADRHRLERHLEEVKSLEARLQDLELPSIEACVLPEHPGDDPPIGAANGGVADGEYEQTAGYSNEELRAEILCDLIHMAFACDLSRVSSVMITMAQCFMNMYELLGHQRDFHDASHGGNLDEVSDACGWHVKHFARLVSKLRDTTDFDGNTLLDNTALVLAFEGGHGFDPATGNPAVAHSTENMALLIAGHAGGLNSGGGQHIQTDQAHPVQVVNTAMRAVGVPDDLGEVSGIIPGLGL